ncbi:hypothetical protein GCM10009565_88870 [Amycolatopsis albidoflavus]
MNTEAAWELSSALAAVRDMQCTVVVDTTAGVGPARRVLGEFIRERTRIAIAGPCTTAVSLEIPVILACLGMPSFRVALYWAFARSPGQASSGPIDAPRVPRRPSQMHPRNLAEIS